MDIILSSYRILKLIYDATCINYETQICSGSTVHKFKNLSALALGELQLSLFYILEDNSEEALNHISQARIKINDLASWVGSQIRGSNNGVSERKDYKAMSRLQ